MAAKYEKLDLSAFKEKLKAGEYASLTGARRAVGRMTTWSEADKNKARALAEKHFGETGEAPKKKAAKKVAKKKATKKAKKKVAKKAAKKVAAKTASKKVAKKSVKKVRRKQAKKSPAEAGSVMDRLTETNLQIQALGQAIDHMGKTKDLGCPNAQVQEGAKLAQQGLIAAVNNLCVLTNESSGANLSSGGNGAVNDAWNTAVDATNATLQGAPPPPPSQTQAAPPEEV